MARYAAFISYAHRYREWVEVLHRNLEHCLAMQGEARQVFLDRVDLGAGRSWVGQLQGGLDRAEHLVLVVTPEAMASPRVADEWASFVALRRDWNRGLLHVVHLVDTPMPPFLDAIQRVDFVDHDEMRYRQGLARLAAGLLGREPRHLPALPQDLEIPGPPAAGLPTDLRQQLVAWLETVLERRVYRRSVATALGLERTALDSYPTLKCAASAALVQTTGDDEPFVAALRMIDVVTEELEEEEPNRVREVLLLREEIAESRHASSSGLLRMWMQRVARDHDRLVPYLQQQAELDVLDPVYVQLELRPERSLALEHNREAAVFDRSWSLRQLLELKPEEHPWVTGRWVLIGDPGAGKTTLLRHLAATLARSSPGDWVPIFGSLPRLLRKGEALLEGIEREFVRHGRAARGLASALDREGQEGRLLLLLDGIDEVPRDDRAESERLLRDLSARWPATPIVVTSRPIGYRSPGIEFRELELLPFDRERRRGFLSRWFGRGIGAPDDDRAAAVLAVLETDPSLWELSGNPLYLTLMALLMERGTSPERHRTRLYDQVFELLLEGGHRPAGEPMEFQVHVRRVLRYLGLAMTADNRDAEPVTELEARLYQPEADELSQPLQRVPRWRRSLRPFLSELAERTGILGPHDGPNADWRFWHRTFREALAAEALEERIAAEGEEALLAHASTIKGDERRWAEPYALLAGRVDDADHFVRLLVRQNRNLGLRALATAQGLRDETLGEILELTDEWQERAEVYGRIPELVGDAERALRLLDRLRRRTRSGNDLFFLERAVATVGQRWRETERFAARLRARLYDHIPQSPEELFRWVETPHDDRVDLWREIPAGTFRMGSPENQGYKREHPSHQVTVSRPFRMAAVPVTNAQYAAFDPNFSPYPWKDVSAEELPRHPVVGITWYEAVVFCRWLSAVFPWMRGVRLPTEEEWEYACRAGRETDYWSGGSPADLSRVAWAGEDFDIGTTHPGGQKPASPWGLYDMHGNVWEWTLTPWTDDYSGRGNGIEIDPAAVEAADLSPDPIDDRRVCRGGCCWDEAEWTRAASRLRASPGIGLRDQGFRLVLPWSPEAPD